MAEITHPWTPKKVDQSWGGALFEGAGNMPSSTIKAGGEIVDAVMSPIDTGTALIKLMSGGLQNILPESVVQFIDPEGKSEESREMANAVGQYFKEKYGGEDNIKHVVATDPASVLMDIATVMTGGAGLVTKVGKLSKISQIENAGNTAAKAATFVDPLTLTAQGVGKSLTIGGTVATELVGATTGVGGTAIGTGFDAAREGAEQGAFLSRGDEGAKFTNAMRGKTDLNDVLQIAMRDLEVMKKSKQDAYRSNELLWKKDNTTLKFDGINQSLVRAEKMVMYKGTIKDHVGLEALNKIKAKIDEWKKNDPSTHHTPEGLDALKQALYSIVEDVPIANGTAKAMAQNVYHSVKDTIVAQAPGYARAMKEYGDASELITQITKTLSLPNKKGASLDTAIRKLNSLLKDNVNTNNGQRAKLGKELENLGGERFMSELAGTQVQSLMPKGLQGAITPSVSSLGALTGAIDPVTAATALAASSPRIVGEATNALGYATGKLDKLPTPSYQGIGGLLEILYQSQSEFEDRRNQ